MAGNIKGITIEFRGDTTKLDKALREIKNSTKDIDKELKDVNKALKFNPTSVELWRQKQELLKQKIKETENNLKELKNMQAQMDAKGVDKNSEEYRKLQREIIETESKLKTFEGQLKKIGNVNLRAMSAQFKDMGDKLTAAGHAMTGLSTAAAAVAASIGALTVKSAKWADDVITSSKVYSMSTKELQKYNAAAQLVDVSADTIAKTHRKLERNMLNAQLGSKKQALAFEELGIAYENADGSLRDGEVVWQETIEALSKMENETERDAYAMSLMGRAATDLNPLIEDGAEGYKLLTQAMEKYDLEFIDDETLQKANDFNDLLDVMKSVGTIAFQQLGTQLAAYLAPALEKVVDLVGKLAKWFSTLSPRTQAIIAGIAAVVAVIAPLLIGLGKISFAISSIMGLMATLGPAIAAISLPMLGVIAAIAAVIAIGVLLYKNWDTIKAKATALKNSIVSTFNQVKSKVTSIFNSIKTAIVTPINTAVKTVQTAINKLKKIINGAKLKLPKIKLPHFSISGKFSLKPPSVPKVSVKWYKQGGIFDSPTIAGIGEAGPEAVVPLDTLWNKLDKIAAASATNNGGIVVNVYGSPGMDVNELAAAVERRLAIMQKQREMAWT